MSSGTSALLHFESAAGWLGRGSPSKLLDMSVFAERRSRVLETLEGTAIIPSAPSHIRNNDVEHAYRQHSDLQYLTGFAEPESCLLLTTSHDKHRAVLFLRPRDPEREQWDGYRLGVERAVEALGVDAAYPIDELPKRLTEYCRGSGQLFYELGQQAELDSKVLSTINSLRSRGRATRPWPQQIVQPEVLLHGLRLVKDDGELASMRHAAEITTEAHLAAMKHTTAGKHEYEIEALFQNIFRRRGCERPAYHPIVGSGPNGTILHYSANNRKMQHGELLLIDAGCEYEYYACDVTRTFPVDGTFSAAQRRVYEVVLNAQLAAIDAARPGGNIEAIHDVTVKALVAGMLDIGLLHGDMDAAIQEKSYRRFYMHRTSHWLGMDVHDVGSYFVDGKPRPFEPNMVLTIEPGIYVAADDEQAPPEYRGLGIRIEDDIRITETEPENLTAAIPKTVADIELACRA